MTLRFLNFIQNYLLRKMTIKNTRANFTFWNVYVTSGKNIFFIEKLQSQRKFQTISQKTRYFRFIGLHVFQDKITYITWELIVVLYH